MNEEFYQALEELENERGIPKDYMLEKIKQALATAYHREYPSSGDVDVILDEDRGSIELYSLKTIVEDERVTSKDIGISQAHTINGYQNAEIGDIVRTKIDTKKFGRMAAQAAKQVIIQGIRESERNSMFREYSSKEHEILATRVYKVDTRTQAAILTLPGKNQTQTLLLPLSDQIKGEVYTEGQPLNVYMIGISKSQSSGPKASREPQIQVSRTHPGFVRKLFESEVTEIFDGTVEIVSVAREAGSRTKIAVRSNDPAVEPVGACVGPKGGRVNAVVSELNGEKIDIIKYSEDPVEFVSAALAPATVSNATLVPEEKMCKIVVADDQLSLAIGKEGQNARLAAKLTGYKIDIKPLSKITE